MKFRKHIFIATIVIGSLFNAASFAEKLQVFEQAGDIAEGKPYVFAEHEGKTASYYKDGTSGEVTFSCELKGDNVTAFLKPGKNFDGNPFSTSLKIGMNGPYTWTLYDRGEKNGNIKVELWRGENVVVQCKEVG